MRRGRAARPAGAAAMRKLGHEGHAKPVRRNMLTWSVWRPAHVAPVAHLGCPAPLTPPLTWLPWLTSGLPGSSDPPAHSRCSHGSPFVSDERGNSCGECGGFATHVRRVRVA